MLISDHGLRFKGKAFVPNAETALTHDQLRQGVFEPDGSVSPLNSQYLTAISALLDLPCDATLVAVISLKRVNDKLQSMPKVWIWFVRGGKIVGRLMPAHSSIPTFLHLRGIDPLMTTASWSQFFVNAVRKTKQGHAAQAA